MSVMEIVLLAAGGLIFILSFIIPAKKEDISELRGLAENEIRDLVNAEADRIRMRADEVMEETSGHAVEKAERAMERLSNEKIMAVSDYSDTVLQEIHRNHEEVMFLYDMLNDKHKNIASTVSKVTRTVKEVEETAREAEAVVNGVKKEAAAVSELKPGVQTEPPSSPEPPRPQSSARPASSMDAGNPDPGAAKEPDISFIDNSNQKILEMYGQGRSKVAIAKELGLGVGEVKLVIDLYRGMQQNT